MSEPPATSGRRRPGRTGRTGRTGRDRRPHLRAAAAIAITTVVGVIGACTGTSGQQVEVAAEDRADDRSTTSTTQAPDCAQMLPVGPAALMLVMVTSPNAAADALAAGQVGGFDLGNQTMDVGSQIVDAVRAPIAPMVGATKRWNGAATPAGAGEILRRHGGRGHPRRRPSRPVARGGHEAARVQLPPVADVGSGRGSAIALRR